jgi:hypothetical protein
MSAIQSAMFANLESSVYGSPAVARRKPTAANRSLYRRDPASGEALLIERLKAGDSEVLEAIFNTYSKKLYKVALRILGEAADTPLGSAPPPQKGCEKYEGPYRLLQHVWPCL